VTNVHSVLHHIVIFKTDAIYTPDEVSSGMMAAFSGTPVAEGFSFFDAAFILASAAISQDQTIWIETTLDPGYYIALCFLPDPGSDTPHAFMGMIDSFEVVED
jgi:hypothetical protein